MKQRRGRLAQGHEEAELPRLGGGGGGGVDAGGGVHRAEAAQHRQARRVDARVKLPLDGPPPDRLDAAAEIARQEAAAVGIDAGGQPHLDVVLERIFKDGLERGIARLQLPLQPAVNRQPAAIDAGFAALQDGAAGQGDFPGRQGELADPPARLLVCGDPPPAVPRSRLFGLAEGGGSGRVELPEAVAAGIAVDAVPCLSRPGNEGGDEARVVAVDAEIHLRVAVRSGEELLTVAERPLAHRAAEEEIAAADDERARPQVRRVAAPGAHRANGELLQPEYAAGLLQGHAVAEHLRGVAVEVAAADRPERLGQPAGVATQIRDVRLAAADPHVAVVVFRPAVRPARVAEEGVPIADAMQSAGSELFPAGGFDHFRRAERRAVAGEAAEQRIGPERERGLHRGVAIDRVFDVDAAAPAGEGRGLGQRGEGPRRRAQPAVAAGRIEPHGAVDDRCPARVDVFHHAAGAASGPMSGCLAERGRPSASRGTSLSRSIPVPPPDW